jgi:hypothetical protein
MIATQPRFPGPQEIACCAYGGAVSLVTVRSRRSCSHRVSHMRPSSAGTCRRQQAPPNKELDRTAHGHRPDRLAASAAGQFRRSPDRSGKRYRQRNGCPTVRSLCGWWARFDWSAPVHPPSLPDPPSGVHGRRRSRPRAPRHPTHPRGPQGRRTHGNSRACRARALSLASPESEWSEILLSNAGAGEQGIGADERRHAWSCGAFRRSIPALGRRSPPPPTNAPSASRRGAPPV